jgi:hypothetical protein
MLSNARIARLVEQETLDGAQAYRPTDFLTDVRRGIWSELSAAQVKIDAFRRNLQRSYFDILAQKLGTQAATDDARAFARGELRALNTAVVAAIAKTTDRPTRLHLEDIRDQIRVSLEPNFVPRAAAALPAFGDDNPMDAYACFPDYSIRVE